MCMPSPVEADKAAFLALFGRQRSGEVGAVQNPTAADTRR